jgi:hypothetical protein
MHLHLVASTNGRSAAGFDINVDRPGKRSDGHLRLIKSSPAESMIDPAVAARGRRRGLLILLVLSALSWLLIGALLLAFL